MFFLSIFPNHRGVFIGFINVKKNYAFIVKKLKSAYILVVFKFSNFKKLK